MSSKVRIDDAYVEELYAGINKGDRLSLAKAITLIESQKAEHQIFAEKLLAKSLSLSGKSMRIGITGTPGVGKSTFIESLGQRFIKAKHNLAVLTVDPTSPVHQGSILGDKSRMEALSNSPQAFVRGSPSRTVLGGATDRTREAIVLCEAAGYDVVFIETVGVGQSEVEIAKMVDFLLLLVLPGSGDEIQGIKRGIVEMADLIAVNKEDRVEKSTLQETLNVYKFALHLKTPKKSGWQNKALSCSALKGSGLDTIYKIIFEYFDLIKKNNYYQENRVHQDVIWLEDTVRKEVLRLSDKRLKGSKKFQNVQEKVKKREWTVHQGAKYLLRPEGGQKTPWRGTKGVE